MRRAFKFNFKDGNSLKVDISDAVVLNDKDGTIPILFNLDKGKKGWRLTFNKYYLPDFSQIENIDIVRED